MDSLTELPAPGPTSTTTPKCTSLLPVEVWLQILSVGELDSNGDFWSTYTPSTMAKICRCCTLFRDQIRPRLYSSFDSALFTSTRHPNFLNLAKFARTLCENPNLCPLVRRVEIRGACPLGNMYGQSSVVSSSAGDPGHPTASVLYQKAAEIGLGEFAYHRAYTDRRRYVPELDLVALVLALLPSLRTLHLYWFDQASPLGCDTETRSVVPSHYIPQPRSVWPWHKSIQNIVLRPVGSLEPTEYNNLSEWGLPPPAHHSFRIPEALLRSAGNLKTLTLIDSVGPGPGPALWLGYLTSLTLKRCRFRPGELGNLLRFSRHLRKFVYTGTGEAGGGGPAPREVVDSLERSRATLKTLGIDLDLGGVHGTQRPARIASLRQFAALRTLYVDVNALWDADLAESNGSPPYPDGLLTTVLPESIEDLALFSTDAYAESQGLRIEAHLRRLALDRREKGAFPNLKTVRGRALSPLEHPVDEELENLSRLAVLDEAKQLLTDDGVDVVFSRPDYSGPTCEDIMSFE